MDRDPRNQRGLTDAELRALETYEVLNELEKRGTAELSNGIVNQVTQAIGEKNNEVESLQFGEMRKEKIIPIDEACAKCRHCYFDTVEKCQERQKKDAVARGFNKLVCPEQFID